MSRPDLFDYDDYRQYLAAWLEFKKQEREAAGLPTYSHRMFAAAAGLSNVGTLVGVISGARNLTPALQQAFRAPLELNDEEARFLDLLATRDERKRDRDRLKREPEDSSMEPAAGDRAARRRQSLAAEQLAKAEAELREAEDAVVGARRMHRVQQLDALKVQVIGSWTASAILELSRCRGFTFDPAWIVAALRGAVTPTEVRDALTLLEEAGTLMRGPDGAPVRSDEPLFVPDGSGSAALWRLYIAMAGRSAEFLHQSSLSPAAASQARVSGLTIALPSSAVPRVRERVAELRKELFQYMEGLQGEPDAVYFAYLHVFPLSEVPTSVPPEIAARGDPPVPPASERRPTSKVKKEPPQR